MAQREPEPHTERPPPVAHQLARCVVDGREMVGVKRVPQPESVGSDPDSHSERARAPEPIVARGYQRSQREEPKCVEGADDAGHQQQRTLLARR